MKKLIIIIILAVIFLTVISCNTKSPIQSASQSVNTTSEEIPAYIKDMINEFESIDWDSSIDDIKKKYPDYLKETPEEFAIYTFSAQGNDFTKLYDGTESKITITYMIDVDNISDANNFFDETSNAFSKRYDKFITSPFQRANNKTIQYALKSDYGYILIGRPTEEERYPGRNLTISFESADDNGIGALTFISIEEEINFCNYFENFNWTVNEEQIKNNEVGELTETTLENGSKILSFSGDDNLLGVLADKKYEIENNKVTSFGYYAEQEKEPEVTGVTIFVSMPEYYDSILELFSIRYGEATNIDLKSWNDSESVKACYINADFGYIVIGLKENDQTETVYLKFYPKDSNLFS